MILVQVNFFLIWKQARYFFVSFFIYFCFLNFIMASRNSNVISSYSEKQKTFLWSSSVFTL